MARAKPLLSLKTHKEWPYPHGEHWDIARNRGEYIVIRRSPIGVVVQRISNAAMAVRFLADIVSIQRDTHGVWSPSFLMILRDMK